MLGIGLIKPKDYVKLWRLSKAETLIATATFIVTISLPQQLYWGIILGVALSLFRYLHARMHPRVQEINASELQRLDFQMQMDGVESGRELMLRLQASLDFATAAPLEQFIIAKAKRLPQLSRVVLVAYGLNHIDATGLQTLIRLKQYLQAQNSDLVIIGAHEKVADQLARAGL